MRTVIIALGHKARHGKDSACQAIIDARGNQYDIRRYAFADALKREINEMADKEGGLYALCLRYGIKYDPTPDMSDPLCPRGKQRDLLQFWGQYRRKEDPFYWVTKTATKIAEDKPQFAIIPDLRYMNEAFFVKANDGINVKVTRYGFFDPSINNEHLSERELENFKFDIEISVLDGEVGQLRKDAVEAFDIIVGWHTPPSLTTDDFTEESLVASIQTAS